MKRLIFIFPFLCCCFLFAQKPKSAQVQNTEAATDAKREKRVALVIGIKSYKYAPPLANSVNDAVDMAIALKALGFEVYSNTDGDLRAIETALNSWGSKLKEAKVALFYFSGHGAEVNGENYLFPVDANPQNPADIPYTCLPIGRVIGKMDDAGTATNIVLLDACRNNPFTRSWNRSFESGGLALINSPKGTFIGYAASPGKVASDGSSRNGTYTQAILKHIKTPGLTIDQVFNRVNKEVREASFEKQIPFKNSSLESDFYFIPVIENTATTTIKETAVEPVKTDVVTTQPDYIKYNLANGLYAVIATSQGDMVLSLDYKNSPVTVANFVNLAEGKMENTAKPKGVPFYDGLTFHRCIHEPDPFMIQAGDPTGNGSGGPGYQFGDEYTYGLKFDRLGVLAMANAGSGTNGSQFFITETVASWLDYKYNVFGQVVRGYNLVGSINNGEVIKKVSIIRIGDEAKAFDAERAWAERTALLQKKAAEFNEALNGATTIEEFIKRNYPTARRTASGLYYVVLKEGNGLQAKKGNKVTVHYNGLLTNGNKFDSSYDRNEPISFTLGSGAMISGFDEGVGLMKVGDKVRLIIPPALGYGKNGIGNSIPGNAIIIFDTELLEVK